jgi:hypothetical protein
MPCVERILVLWPNWHNIDHIQITQTTLDTTVLGAVGFWILLGPGVNYVPDKE